MRAVEVMRGTTRLQGAQRQKENQEMVRLQNRLGIIQRGNGEKQKPEWKEAVVGKAGTRIADIAEGFHAEKKTQTTTT